MIESLVTRLRGRRAEYIVFAGVLEMCAFVMVCRFGTVVSSVAYDMQGMELTAYECRDRRLACATRADEKEC